MTRHLQPEGVCVCEPEAVSMALQAGCQNVCSRSFQKSAWETSSGAQQGPAKERKQPHMSKIKSTCRADTVLLLGSTASSSRTLCNASAGDAQVMLEELCRRTAMINHLSMLLHSALLFLACRKLTIT